MLSFLIFGRKQMRWRLFKIELSTHRWAPQQRIGMHLPTEKSWKFRHSIVRDDIVNHLKMLPWFLQNIPWPDHKNASRNSKWTFLIQWKEVDEWTKHMLNIQVAAFLAWVESWTAVCHWIFLCAFKLKGVLSAPPPARLQWKKSH